MVQIFKRAVLVLFCSLLWINAAVAGLSCHQFFRKHDLDMVDAGTLFTLTRDMHFSLEKDPFARMDAPNRVKKGIVDFVRDFPKMAEDSAFYSVIDLDSSSRASLNGGDIIELKAMLPAFPETSLSLLSAKQFILDDAKAGQTNLGLVVSLRGSSGRDLRQMNLLNPQLDPWVVFLPGTRFISYLIQVGDLQILQLTEVED